MVRRAKGQDEKTGETICWLTRIPIDVHVLHPAVIGLQLIYSTVNMQIDP